MEQHSAEWWEAKRGKVGASRICDVVARTKKGWGAGRKHYLAELVAERLTGKNKDRKRVPSLEHRLDLEPDARAAYEFYSDNTVELVGFIEHPRIPDAGASPDGLVGLDGGIEIKCLDYESFLDVITADAIDRDYILQMQFGMACTNRHWWDFVAYEPNMPEELRLYVKRIERDDALIADIERDVVEFLTEVDLKVAQVRGLMQNKTPLSVALEESVSKLGLVH